LRFEPKGRSGGVRSRHDHGHPAGRLRRADIWYATAASRVRRMLALLGVVVTIVIGLLLFFGLA
jgi:hypothetical protein